MEDLLSYRSHKSRLIGVETEAFASASIRREGRSLLPKNG
jgi:hypothetical protein